MTTTNLEFQAFSEAFLKIIEDNLVRKRHEIISPSEYAIADPDALLHRTRRAYEKLKKSEIYNRIEPLLTKMDSDFEHDYTFDSLKFNSGDRTHIFISEPYTYRQNDVATHMSLIINFKTGAAGEIVRLSITDVHTLYTLIAFDWNDLLPMESKSYRLLIETEYDKLIREFNEMRGKLAIKSRYCHSIFKAYADIEDSINLFIEILSIRTGMELDLMYVKPTKPNTLDVYANTNFKLALGYKYGNVGSQFELDLGIGFGGYMSATISKKIAYKYLTKEYAYAIFKQIREGMGDNAESDTN